MKKIFLTSLFIFSALVVSTREAQAQSGNPVGWVDTVTCSSISGWSYDPSVAPPTVFGCTNPSATNYNPSATNNDGSCVMPPVVTPTMFGCTNPSATNYNPSATNDDGSCQFVCVSRYRWVNIGGGGSTDPATGCAAVGASPVGSSANGVCASGENRPAAGYGYTSIDYARGTWGGGGGKGGDFAMFQNGGYRCYANGQKQDKDNTDIAIAYYCDFGSSYSDSCPADNPAPPSGGGGVDFEQCNSPGSIKGSCFRNNLNLLPTPVKTFSLFELFKPLIALAASSDSNSVQIYDGSSPIATVSANQFRGDVNAVMGVTGNHGFSWTVSESLKDGASHQLHFYGTNIDSQGSTSELSGSPVTIQCAAPSTPNNPPSTPSISCPANGSFTNTALDVAFSSTDPDGNGVQYHIDWDNNGTTDQIVPSGTFAQSGSQQSATRSWSTPGSKTVSVKAEDNQGAFSSNTSCSFTLADNPTVSPPQCSDGIDNDGDGFVDMADPGCTDSTDNDETNAVAPNFCALNPTDPSCAPTFCQSNPTDPSCTTGGGSGPGTSAFCSSNPSDPSCSPGSSFCSSNPSAPSCLVTPSGFTISGDQSVPIVILASIGGTSQPAAVRVNPVSGFSNAVSLSIQSIRSGSGADLTNAQPTFTWENGTPMETMVYNPSFGEYVASSGLIGAKLTIAIKGKITEPYYVTILGTSGSKTATYVLKLDPNPVNPSFNER